MRSRNQRSCVGGLVEQQDVAAGEQRASQVDAVALAAGDLAHQLLLVAALETEGGHVGTSVDLAIADAKPFLPAADHLPDTLLAVQGSPTLIDVRQLDGVAETQAAGVRLLLADDHPKQRGLAGAVGTDHADDAAAGQAERGLVEQQLVVEALAQLLGLDHHLAEARPGRDRDFGGIQSALLLVRRELLVGLDARLALGLTRPRRHAHPLELALQGAPPRRGLLPLDGEALLLLLEPGRVVALPRDAAAAVQLEDPLGDVVQEVAIVRDGHDRARVFLEMAFEPRDGLGIEMVGRLVEQQQVGFLE